MQKFSSFGRKKKKQTKIRHRMVMLEDLQLLYQYIEAVSKLCVWLYMDYNLKNFCSTFQVVSSCLQKININDCDCFLFANKKNYIFL